MGEKVFEVEVETWLDYLDLASLADWDVLVFLYRHRASLASAEQISRLVGYTTAIVGDALEFIESHGLVRRSRASQGVRLYQFADSASPSRDTSARDGFARLIRLAETRTGRLLIARKLRERIKRRRSADEDCVRLVVKGSAKWPKAV